MKLLPLLITIIVTIVLYFSIEGNKEDSTAKITPEQAYKSYLHLLDCGDADSLRFGLAKMDSLANVNYVPAMYEMFYTYGWFSDEKSLKRKELLGIEVYETGHDKCLPKSYEINNKATSYLNRIIENPDTLHPDIKAESTYRLAAYYLNTDKVYSPNLSRAKSLLEQSKEYAIKAGNRSLLEKIKNLLKLFEQ